MSVGNMRGAGWVIWLSKSSYQVDQGDEARDRLRTTVWQRCMTGIVVSQSPSMQVPDGIS